MLGKGRVQKSGHQPGLGARHTLPKGYQGAGAGLYLDWRQGLSVSNMAVGPLQHLQYQVGHTNAEQPKEL